MSQGASSDELENVKEHLSKRGLKVHMSEGIERTVVGVIGQIYPELQSELELMDGVGEVVRISKLKLRNVGLSGQKVKYLKDLGARFLDGSIRPHRLTYQNNEEVIETLTSVYGIGRWTAEMFLLFTLRRPDIFPVTDLGVQKGFQIFYSLVSYLLE